MSFKTEFYFKLKKWFKNPELKKLGFWIYGVDQNFSINEEDICLNGERWDGIEETLGLDLLYEISLEIKNLKQKIATFDVNVQSLDLLEEEINIKIDCIKKGSSLLSLSDEISEFFQYSWALREDKEIKSKKALFEKLVGECPNYRTSYFIEIDNTLNVISVVEAN